LNKNKIHQGNLATVHRLLEAGQSADTIREMQPHLAEAVDEVVSGKVIELSNEDEADGIAKMNLEVARYGAQRGGGSGAATQPVFAGEEVLG
jgi:hypothetical protein